MPVHFCGINHKFVEMDSYTRGALRNITDTNRLTLEYKVYNEISLNLKYKLSTLRYFTNREEAMFNLGAICSHWYIRMRFDKL